MTTQSFIYDVRYRSKECYGSPPIDVRCTMHAEELWLFTQMTERVCVILCAPLGFDWEIGSQR